MSRFKIYILIILSLILAISAIFIASPKQPSGKELSVLGEKAYKKGNVKQSIKYLNEAVVKKDRQFKTYYLLGKSYESLGDTNEAIKYIRIASNKKPKDSEVQYNLATLYKSSKQLDKAIIKLQEALSVDPAFISAKLMLAKTYYENKNYKESIQTYKNLLQSTNPLDKTQIKIELAAVYLSVSNASEAKRLITEVLKKDPDNSEALKLRESL